MTRRTPFNYTQSHKAKQVEPITRYEAILRYEAMRLAKAHIRSMIRQSGGKLSHYASKDIALASSRYLQDNQWLLAQARSNLMREEGEAQ
jgi:hypothetical protein